MTELLELFLRNSRKYRPQISQINVKLRIYFFFNSWNTSVAIQLRLKYWQKKPLRCLATELFECFVRIYYFIDAKIWRWNDVFLIVFIIALGISID